MNASGGGAEICRVANDGKKTSWMREMPVRRHMCAASGDVLRAGRKKALRHSGVTERGWMDYSLTRRDLGTKIAISPTMKATRSSAQNRTK